MGAFNVDKALQKIETDTRLYQVDKIEKVVISLADSRESLCIV